MKPSFWQGLPNERRIAAALTRQPGLVSALPSRPAVELAGYAVFVAGLILLHVHLGRL